jgi:hypothetical protein
MDGQAFSVLQRASINCACLRVVWSCQQPISADQAAAIYPMSRVHIKRL